MGYEAGAEFWGEEMNAVSGTKKQGLLSFGLLSKSRALRIRRIATEYGASVSNIKLKPSRKRKPNCDYQS